MNDIVLSGKIEFLELSELLQLIGNNGCSGVLSLKNPHTATPAKIYFEKGNPINASQSSKTGLPALLDLFAWNEGTFEFRTTVIPVKHVIKKNRMEIILDGLRMLDDGKISKPAPKDAGRPQTSTCIQASGVPLLKGPLVDYIYIADEETYQSGDKIVEEGKHGSWMWVILEGIVDIVKRTPKGEMIISSISDGSFVGDIATFLAREHVRGASAVARGKVQLGVVDSQRLSNEFSALSREFRDLLLSFDQRLKQVSGNALRIRLDQPLLADLQHDLSPFSFESGGVESVYRIKKGKAVVSRPMGKSTIQVVLAELSVGDFLGHIPFLNTGLEPYGAGVLVSKDLELEKIDPERFQPEYDVLSNTFKNIIENISASISVTVKTAEHFFNQGFHQP